MFETCLRDLGWIKEMNYRPISNVRFISKRFERLIARHMEEHLSRMINVIKIILLIVEIIEQKMLA